ncbi:Beta-TrCP [Arthrobotrys entomopaga]|nr:Beta-TrCP [Arthrobotrys entomopaga]
MSSDQYPTPQKSPSPIQTSKPSAARIVPLTCHGHSRPVVHLSFSQFVDDTYFLISACKDGNPMLRDGITGDWIGTFIGHKGAIWQARLSRTASLAATASADFSAKIWDAFTGETLHTLNHNHIVRCVTFSPDDTRVATGGPEKKLRMFDLGRPDNAGAMEIGVGAHNGSIRTVSWADQNILVSGSEDKYIRWWDVRSKDIVSTYMVDEPLASCEFSTDGKILNVSAGKSVYFFDGLSRMLLKSIKTEHDCATVALHPPTSDVPTRKFVTGGAGDTWVRVYDFDSGRELELNKGHHGPIWSASFSPDGNLYATGSEDGTIKLWKYTPHPYGLWMSS